METFENLRLAAATAEELAELLIQCLQGQELKASRIRLDSRHLPPAR